jgi:hypothetical protein
MQVAPNPQVSLIVHLLRMVTFLSWTPFILRRRIRLTHEL